MTCAVVRAQMLIGEDAEAGKVATELADLFCRGSRRRVELLFTGLLHNDDAHEYAAAQRVLDGAFMLAEQGVLDPSGEGPMIGLPPRDAAKDVHRSPLRVRRQAREKEKQTEAEAVGAKG
jgi:hypothetical protein